jgi:hypothetical protein
LSGRGISKLRRGAERKRHAALDAHAQPRADTAVEGRDLT